MTSHLLLWKVWNGAAKVAHVLPNPDLCVPLSRNGDADKNVSVQDKMKLSQRLGLGVIAVWSSYQMKPCSDVL